MSCEQRRSREPFASSKGLKTLQAAQLHLGSVSKLPRPAPEQIPRPLVPPRKRSQAQQERLPPKPRPKSEASIEHHLANARK